MNATWIEPLTRAKEDAAHETIKDKCCCLEYEGDNPNCPIHGRPSRLLRDYRRMDKEGQAEARAELAELTLDGCDTEPTHCGKPLTVRGAWAWCDDCGETFTYPELEVVSEIHRD